MVSHDFITALPLFLTDQLANSNQGADSAHPLLLAPPNFFTFRHRCKVNNTFWFESFKLLKLSSPFLL